jgi:protein-S-isoprenylcysteine O-methyltransferase Ste14
MLPLPYTHLTARILFAAACLVWVIPEMIGMSRQMARVSRQSAAFEDRRSLAVLLGLQWTGVALNFLLAGLVPSAAIGWQRAALFGLGVLCIPLGVGLRWYAIRTLGRYFTRDVAVSADQPVVECGPYRRIRHPAYTGTFLTMLGVGLAMTNWASLGALLACVFAGHYYRVRVEERALLQAIGQPYRDYMRRTRRFIPWLI